jgi:hypothetical protein
MLLMTLLLAWIGVDRKKHGKAIASLYLAADSRFSWGAGVAYDQGSKVFGANAYPEVFGFWGDVTFSTLILGQLVTQIDQQLLITELDTPADKNAKVLGYIETSLNEYPKVVLVQDFSILYGTRVGKDFYLFQTTYSRQGGISNRQLELPLQSDVVYRGGTGAAEFDRNWVRWKDKHHNDVGTSRAVYHCLEATLAEIQDASTGGMPQVMGLYRIGNARLFGIVHRGKRYLFGKERAAAPELQSIEWRNENFERMDPASLQLIEGAQRQPPS